jgi:alcohol dehydrogenase
MTQTHSRSWNFQNPVHVHFGAGTRAALAGNVAGKRVLAVTTKRGKEQFLNDDVLRGIDAEIEWVSSVTSNPGLAETQAEIDKLAGQEFDCVVAFGGGSAMDAAKALAAALTPGLETRDLATLIAQPGTHLNRRLLPIHALATTSGTGAEVTPFATIWDHAKYKKLSLASPRLFPATAIVDPELTHGLPHEATMSTGFDALNQALESVWNRNRTPVTTHLASRAVALAFEALPRLAADLDDHGARAGIAEASLLAGMCISQTRTAICHSMSYPITAHFGMPHGIACAFTMQAVAHRVLAEAPEGLAEIAVLAGLGDAEGLVARLDTVVGGVDLRALANRWLPNDPATLLDLRSEMITPNRSDNFVLPMDHDTIAGVLEASL